MIIPTKKDASAIMMSILLKLIINFAQASKLKTVISKCGYIIEIK